MRKRTIWIDNMKALGIILVLIGHNESSITQYIYSFHMPLFFFISGLLFSYNGEITFIEYVKKKFKSLMIPYFKISSILFIIWYTLSGRNQGITVVLKNLFGVAYSQGGGEYMAWGIPMWFIPCLFLTNITLFLLLRYKKKYLLHHIFTFSILGYTLGIIRKGMMNNGQEMLRLPWSFDVMLIGIVFFVAGYLLKDKVEKIKDKKINIIFSSILFLGAIILSKINGRIDMYTLNYKNYFLLFITGGLGILGCIYISRYIKENKVFLKMGENTIYLLAFHINILAIIKRLINIVVNDMAIVERIIRIDFIAIVVIPSIQISSIFIGIYIWKRVCSLLKKKYFISS